MVGLLSNYTSPFDAYANFKQQQVPTIGINTPITGVSLNTIQYPIATPLSYRGNQQYNTYGLGEFTGYQPKGYTVSTPKAISPYAGTELEGLSSSEITNKMRERGTDKSPQSLWNIFTDGLYNNFKENPTGFVGGLINSGGNLWGAYEQYRNNKKALAAQQEAYELQKQLALNAEQRNQEQWDMTKRQRASSSL